MLKRFAGVPEIDPEGFDRSAFKWMAKGIARKITRGNGSEAFDLGMKYLRKLEENSGPWHPDYACLLLLLSVFLSNSDDKHPPKNSANLRMGNSFNSEFMTWTFA